MKHPIRIIITTFSIILITAIVMYMMIPAKTVSQTSIIDNMFPAVAVADNELTETKPATPAVPERQPVTHMTMPDPVRAVYMSSWIASSSNLRSKIVELAKTTEINAIVIDIKDSTGKVSFSIDNPLINELGSTENRIRDIDEFINELHSHNIYVIGRISVFQDPYLTHEKPEWAITRKSDGAIWKDRKGLSFLSPAKPEVWDYITTLAIESYKIGFDEINFDYIRFPSDGNIADIQYPDPSLSKADYIENFFKHLDQVVRKENNIPTSADLFGMVTTANDDLGIGQVLERAIPYFDAIAPMIYPSHYPKNFQGYANPASNPGSIITIAMEGGNAKAVAMGKTSAVFRPWLQDFNMGANYGPTEIRAQINALAKLGIHSYMMWDPANTYTAGGYLPE